MDQAASIVTGQRSILTTNKSRRHVLSSPEVFATIVDWLRVKPTTSTLHKPRHAANVSIDYLIEEKNSAGEVNQQLLLSSSRITIAL